MTSEPFDYLRSHLLTLNITCYLPLLCLPRTLVVMLNMKRTKFDPGRNKLKPVLSSNPSAFLQIPPLYPDMPYEDSLADSNRRTFEMWIYLGSQG